MNDQRSQGRDGEVTSDVMDSLRDASDAAANDPALVSWLGEVSQTLQAQIANETNVRLSGLASIFEEVHQRDPSRVSAAMLDTAWQQAHTEDRARAQDPRVQVAVIAARAAARRDGLGKRPVPRFAAGLPGRSSQRHLRWQSTARVLAVLAAAMALVIGLDRFAGVSVLDLAGLGAADHQLAVDHHDLRATHTGVLVAGRASLRSTTINEGLSSTAVVAAEVVVPDPAPGEDVAVDEVAIEAVPDDARAARPTKVERASRAAHLREQLLRWDDDAQKAWREGRHAEATRLFDAIIRTDRQGNFAQAAYGDLFLLARESGDVGQRRRLWQTYLRTFPHGRFADDARAGLCRTTDFAGANECWDKYLGDFPVGAHRSEAEKMRSQP